MKEIYFNIETIDTVSNELVNEIRSTTQTSKIIFDPNDSALLVLDMQKYFLKESSHAFIPSAPAIIPGIKKLIAEFHKRNRPVILTRHLNNDKNAGQMAKWWSEIITEDNALSEIIPELGNDNERVIIKHQYDAFFETKLKQLLNDMNIRQVIIAGIMTHLCCETTARSAFINDFEVLFTADGTATYNPDFHKSTLKNLAHGFAEIVTINELLRKLNANEIG